MFRQTQMLLYSQNSFQWMYMDRPIWIILNYFLSPSEETSASSDPKMTYWCLVGNGWEWGNGMIIHSYCGSFPHSLLSTRKMKKHLDPYPGGLRTSITSPVFHGGLDQNHLPHWGQRLVCLYLWSRNRTLVGAPKEHPRSKDGIFQPAVCHRRVIIVIIYHISIYIYISCIYIYIVYRYISYIDIYRISYIIYHIYIYISYIIYNISYIIYHI